jgi:hypothetical protein
MLAAQFVQRRYECWLPHDPCAVFVMTSSRKPSQPITNGVAPFAEATDVDAIRRLPTCRH